MEEQMKMSHVEAAQNLQKAKTELFKQM
jgi:hypothetical protein